MFWQSAIALGILIAIALYFMVASLFPRQKLPKITEIRDRILREEQEKKRANKHCTSIIIDIPKKKGKKNVKKRIRTGSGGPHSSA